MFCTNCGATVSDDMAYCKNCGALLKTEAGNREKARMEAEAAGQAPQQGVEANTVGSAGSSHGRTAAIAVIAALAALAVVVAVLFVTETGPFSGQDSTTVHLDSTGEGSAAVGQETVGDYTGMQLEEAQDAVEDDGFAVGEVSEEHSETVDEGCVISQGVEAGSHAHEGTEIGLVVSSGPAEHSYTLVEQDMTWSQAEAYCEEHGGYLACITSAEENEKVLDLVRGSGCTVFWIGAQRDSHGDFTWVNGDDMAFTDWAAGEPNNDVGSEDVAAIFHTSNGIGWYDTLDDVSAYYRPTTMAFIMETEDE